MSREIRKNLEDLGFKDNEIKVYLALTNLGEAKASEIAKRAGLPRTTAISILEKLRDDSYLTTHSFHGTTFYWIESPAVLVDIFRHKTDIASSLCSMLTDEYRKEAHFPFGKIIDTKSGIRNYIDKLLLSLPKNSLIRTIDQPKAGNYAKIFSGTASDILISYKEKRKVRTHSLVPFESCDERVMQKASQQNIEIRELPKGLDFHASLWLIGKQAFLFSGNPPFLVVVQHEMIVKSLESIYEWMWGISNNRIR